MSTILDLPVEILEYIFSYLHLNLSAMMEIATVCSKFRMAVLTCQVPIRLPLHDQQLHLMSKYKIPILNLYNEQPALYINYQVRKNFVKLNFTSFCPEQKLVLPDPQSITLAIVTRCFENKNKTIIVVKQKYHLFIIKNDKQMPNWATLLPRHPRCSMARNGFADFKTSGYNGKCDRL